MAAVVLLVAVAAVVGWRVGRSERHPSAAAAAPSTAHGAQLVVGAVVANRPPDYAGPEFVATLYNTGDRSARVTEVAPVGWSASVAPVTVPPGGAVAVPVDAQLDCRSTPPPSNEISVADVSAGRTEFRTLHLAAVPEALTEKYERTCRTPPGHRPQRDELVGIWIVDEADFFAGQMLIDLRANGTYAMDPFTTLFSGPGAFGTFTYRAGRLDLSTRGGVDCANGDGSRWRVGLLSDGRLRMQLVDQVDGVCTVELGEVWIARRVSPPPAANQ